MLIRSLEDCNTINLYVNRGIHGNVLYVYVMDLINMNIIYCLYVIHVFVMIC